MSARASDRALTRRALLAGAGTALLAGPATATDQAAVYVISRSRLLNEAEPTRKLRQAEAALTARLQEQLDRIKSALAREEADLARRRDEIDPSEMILLSQDFDRRVRLTRRLAQERAAVVTSAFQDARAELVQKLPPILERLRKETGAVAILDADQTMAIAPENDLTDRAIDLLNEALPDPSIPEIDVTLDLPTTPEPEPPKQ